MSDTEADFAVGLVFAIDWAILHLGVGIYGLVGLWKTCRKGKK